MKEGFGLRSELTRAMVAPHYLAFTQGTLDRIHGSPQQTGSEPYVTGFSGEPKSLILLANIRFAFAGEERFEIGRKEAFSASSSNDVRTRLGRNYEQIMTWLPYNALREIESRAA